MHAYSDTAALVAALPELSTLSTAALLRLLTGAADDIDRYCSLDGLRQFQPYLATLDFAPDSEILNLPDLLSVTSVTQDLDADQTYGTTWATTDYRLWPLNAPTRREPYTQLRTLPLGNYTLGWPRGWTGGWPKQYLEVFGGPILGAPSIRIVGKWGYRETLEDTGATAAEAIDDSETVIDVSNQALLGVGQTILIDSEQMFITALTDAAQDTMTVLRAQNGTVAASHLTSAPISRYLYPSAVIDATYALIAVRRRAPAAAGVISERVGDIAVSYSKPMEWSAIEAALDPFLGSLRRPEGFA